MQVPVPLRRAFTAEIDVPAAAEEQRARTLTRMLGSTTNTASLDSDGMRSAAQSMAGFLPCDLAAMACDATLAVLREKINDGADDVVRVPVLKSCISIHISHILQTDAVVCVP